MRPQWPASGMCSTPMPRPVGKQHAAAAPDSQLRISYLIVRGFGSPRRLGNRDAAFRICNIFIKDRNIIRM